MKSLIFKRKTLKQPFVLTGCGLHSGAPITLSVKPGRDGIIFHCMRKSVRATPDNVTKTTLCTCLGEISTIEHLMSALAAMEITDVDIELDSPELPALDGGSAIYCEHIAGAGLIEVGESCLELSESDFLVEEGDYSISLQLGNGKLAYHFDTGDRWPHKQIYEIEFSQESYVKDLAPARTFGFEEQLPQIQAAGLARGLDLTNALVLGKEGYVNEPHFHDEPVRHKLLDMIGDLYLAGVPIRFFDAVGYKSGHTGNVSMANKLFASIHTKTSA